MARIRTIKPEFWMHENLSALPEATHMLAAALLNHADDEGYFNANPGLIKAACSPLREPSVSIQESLNSLVSIGYIEIFSGTDGKRYGYVVKFDEHQRVNRPTPSKIKRLCGDKETSLSTHTQLTEPSPPERNREGKGTGNGEASQAPTKKTSIRGTRLPEDWSPTPEQIAWARKERPDIDPVLEARSFRNHWVAKPGKDAVKLSWNATWENWITRAYASPKKGAAQPNYTPLPGEL